MEDMKMKLCEQFGIKFIVKRERHPNDSRPWFYIYRKASLGAGFAFVMSNRRKPRRFRHLDDALMHCYGFTDSGLNVGYIDGDIESVFQRLF